MNKAKKRRLNLALTLTLYILAIMMAAMIISMAVVRTLMWFGLMDFPDLALFQDAAEAGWGGFSGMFFILAVSGFLGIAISIFFNKKALSPIRKLIKATNQIASGDFDVQLELKGVSELEDLSNSFNKMAKELASIETLRRDFINNFSHEFKTPIVSISGFAELMIEGGLTEDEKKEYLGIIVAESKRLSNLSAMYLIFPNTKAPKLL